jgi:hypothetical protein
MRNFTSGVTFNQSDVLARPTTSQPVTGDPSARALVLRPIGMLRLTGLLLGLPLRRPQVM